MLVPVRRSRSLLIPVALITFGSLSQARDARRARPPDSLRPVTEKGSVRVQHVHHRVRHCKRVAIEQRFHCIAELEDAETSATLSFELLAPPSTVEGDRRRRVVLKLPQRLGPQKAEIELAHGHWSVDWRGHTTCASLTISSKNSPVIALETTSGRCELRRSQCRHDEEAVVRLMTITDMAR